MYQVQKFTACVNLTCELTKEDLYLLCSPGPAVNLLSRSDLLWLGPTVPLDIWVGICCVILQDVFELLCCEITELDWHSYIQEDCTVARTYCRLYLL